MLSVAALYDAVPPGDIDRILAEVVEAKDTDPLVAAQAAFLLSRIEDDRGPDGAGDRRRAGLGLLTRFWVVGPFGDGPHLHGVIPALGREDQSGVQDPSATVALAAADKKKKPKATRTKKKPRAKKSPMRNPK